MVSRIVIVITVLFWVSACRPDASEGTITVRALLAENQQAELFVAVVKDFEERPLLPGARVTLTEENGTVWLMEAGDDEPNVYRHPAGQAVIQAGTNYRIEVTQDGHFATAEAFVPEPINLVQVSTTQIPVNAMSTGQPIFTVLWTNDPLRSKVLVLQEPQGAQEIPFNVPSGNFAMQYRLPVPGSGTTLFDTDFKFYGTHELEIYSIDKAFEALFFYTPAEGGRRLTSGPSNVQGGAGFVAGASKTVLTIEILP